MWGRHEVGVELFFFDFTSAALSTATKSLNLLGEIEGVACIANKPERRKQLKKAHALSTALATLFRVKQAEAKVKAKEKKWKQAKKLIEKKRLQPILSLLEKAKLWPPPRVEGANRSQTVTAKLLKQYLHMMDIWRFVPRVSKAKSKAKLVSCCRKQK